MKKNIAPAIQSAISAGLGSLIFRNKVRSFNEGIEDYTDKITGGIKSGAKWLANKVTDSGTVHNILGKSVNKVAKSDSVQNVLGKAAKKVGQEAVKTFSQMDDPTKAVTAAGAGIGGYLLGKKIVGGTKRAVSNIGQKIGSTYNALSNRP